MNFKLKVRVKKAINSPKGIFPYTLGFAGLLDQNYLAKEIYETIKSSFEEYLEYDRNRTGS
jgi:hypothetical protein